MIYRQPITKVCFRKCSGTPTPPAEVLRGVFTRQGNSWGDSPKELHDLSDVVCSERRQQTRDTSREPSSCQGGRPAAPTFLQGKGLASFGFKQRVSGEQFKRLGGNRSVNKPKLRWLQPYRGDKKCLLLWCLQSYVIKVTLGNKIDPL